LSASARSRRRAPRKTCPRRRRNPLPEPRLSALVVARNEEAALEACLARLAFADELVVVLDRCTDGSAAIAARYADTLIEGGWEIEGERRNLGICACSGEWILEADADEHVGEALAREIRAAIRTGDYDVFDIPVRNFIGTRYVRYGWGGGSFGKNSYQGLFRKGVKWWGDWRVHPHVTVTGRAGPDLTHAVDHFVDRDISDMLRRLDRYTDFRARDLVDLGETRASLATMFRKFLSRFWKIYVVRKAYKEKELGFMVALCGALYPLIAHIKAVELAERGEQA
jgi:glycosyltransferase involved in cell wall biosynthesis